MRVVLTGHGSIEAAVGAMKQGVYDFLTKPPDADRLLHLVQRAAEPEAPTSRATARCAGRGARVAAQEGLAPGTFMRWVLHRFVRGFSSSKK